MCFDLVAAVCIITMEQRIYFYGNFFWEFFICLTPFFRDKLNWLAALSWWMNLFPWQWLPWKYEKDHFSVIITIVAIRKKSSIKNLDLVDLNYHYKNWIDWISARWNKVSQPQKCTFLEKGGEIQKHNNFVVRENLPQFTLRIETG